MLSRMRTLIWSSSSSIDGEAVLVAGKRQISARAGIDKFTGEPVQPGQGMIPGEFTQALLQRVQGHLAVHKEHRDLALHRPFEEGSRHAQTEGEFQKPVRFAHTARPVDHGDRPFGEPVEIEFFRGHGQFQEVENSRLSRL